MQLIHIDIFSLMKEINKFYNSGLWDFYHINSQINFMLIEYNIVITKQLIIIFSKQCIEKERKMVTQQLASMFKFI